MRQTPFRFSKMPMATMREIQPSKWMKQSATRKTPLEPRPNSHTLTQDESNEMRQPKEEDEKHSKRARKKTKSHKAEKSTTVKKARNAKRSKTALEPTRPLQPESSSGPTDEPKSCHDWGPPHLIGWGWHPIQFPEDESWTQSRERRERL